MNHDGRDADDADWLLAQLVNGPTPARQDPPVAPPPAAVTPPEPIASQPAAPPQPQTPAPRREEVLDWFSLAEPASAPDAATRALPVIGGPLPAATAPTAPEPRVEPPVAGSTPPAQVSDGLPAWNPPFTVGRPGAATPPTPSAVPLASVEPPVGPAVPPPPVPPTSFVPPAAPPTTPIPSGRARRRRPAP